LLPIDRVKIEDIEYLLLNLHIETDLGPGAYIRSILYLIVIGFQTDSTRVITYMMAGEDVIGNGGNFTKIALALQGHHAISHDKAIRTLGRLGKICCVFSKPP